MKGTIEITIRKNEDGKFYTGVTARGCKRKDITFAGLLGAMSLVVNDIDKNIPDADKRQLAEAFGDMMGQMMLGMLTGRTTTQRTYEGKEAEFLSALMKRQGEVLDE